MKVPADVIVQAGPRGSWIFYNVYTRDALAAGAGVCDALSIVERSGPAKAKRAFAKKVFEVFDIGTFPNRKGLLVDPTPWLRDEKKWPKPLKLSCNELLVFLQTKNILVADEKKYIEQFKRKTSLLDTAHLGNFHEQLGQKLMIEERVNPDLWWARQKFNAANTALNDTLYKAVQGTFLDTLFKTKLHKKDTVVDLGCGTGFYARRMARFAGKVIGLDPNESYIKLAQKNAPRNATFVRSAIGNGKLNLPDKCADVVYMSDALLFYFVSPDPHQKPDLQALFKEVRRILKPGGRFFSLEPHGIFWLQPWLGEIERPFTVLTEYESNRYKVTPHPSQIISAYLRAGFVLESMQELLPTPAYKKKDPRGYQFAKEFPLWWFFELRHGK